MCLDYDVFEQALSLFHAYSLQNDEAVNELLRRGILPATPRSDFSVLDIGSGQGYLPGLMQRFVSTLVLVEPNPRCVQRLQEQFECVYPISWGDEALCRIRADHPQGFDLVTMSHMLYHFHGIDDIREKIRMALTLVTPGGHLAIVINQPQAPTARIGIGFQVAEGRLDEASTNDQLHAHCHDVRFYEALSSEHAGVAIYPLDTPLHEVPSREDLVTLFRMALLNPLSEAPCDTASLDRFIARYLDATYPALTYPATIPSVDDLIVIRTGGAAGRGPGSA
jgi:SAM-dependent methyltransferase